MIVPIDLIMVVAVLIGLLMISAIFVTMPMRMNVTIVFVGVDVVNPITVAGLARSVIAATK